MFSSEASGEDQGTVNRQWDLYWIRPGLGVYEQLVVHTTGLYSVGDQITMADVCLVPELWTALRYGLELEEYPTISAILQRLVAVEAFAKEGPEA